MNVKGEYYDAVRAGSAGSAVNSCVDNTNLMPLGLVQQEWWVSVGQVAKLGMKLDSPTFLAIIQGK